MLWPTACGLVTGLLDGLPGDQARGCLLAAAGGGSQPQYRRAAACHRRAPARPSRTPWPAARPPCPIDVLRLISELRRAGRSDVAQPRCADCGRDRFLRAHRPDGQRVCASCSQAYHLPERCGRCGQQARVCARDPGGGAVCGRCRRADPAAWKPCGICGHDGWARITINGTRIGDCCYLHPHERCSACGIGRAVSPYKTRKATCAACASRPARSVQLLRPGRPGAPTGRGAVVPALRLGCDPPVRWLPGADRQPRRRRGAPLPGLLLPAPAGLRAVRAGPRHRPAGGRR